jgi:hypothetical protein
MQSTFAISTLRRSRPALGSREKARAAVNRCIEALEKADADPRDLEVLTTHALTLAERIDEMRWLNPAKALDWLFEHAIPQRPLKESEKFRA